MTGTQTSVELSSIHTTRSSITLQVLVSDDQTSHHVDIDESNLVVPPDHATEAIPDGGYGWTVVFASSVMTFWLTGWCGSWGILQTALLQSHLITVSTSTISFVGSLALASTVAFGLLSVRLAKAISARYSAVLGVVFMGLGILLSSFTTENVGGMFITSGAMTGIGCSLLYTMANIVPVQWFSGRLGTANGLIKVGGGIGATVLSLANQALLDRVGIIWTFRIVGLVCLATGIPTALLIKERVPSSTTGPVLNLRLFKSLPFSALFFAGATGTFALFVPPFFLPLFAHSIGLSASAGAGITAAFNACTAIGRFVAGFACDRYGPINMLLLAMCLNAASMLAIWPVSSSIGPLAVFAAINGIANGAFYVTMPTSVATMIGPGHASAAMSMSITGWTAGYLMGSPIAGILISATGAERSSSIEPHRAAIFYAGSVALASGAFVLMARLGLDTKLRKKL